MKIAAGDTCDSGETVAGRDVPVPMQTYRFVATVSRPSLSIFIGSTRVLSSAYEASGRGWTHEMRNANHGFETDDRHAAGFGRALQAG